MSTPWHAIRDNLMLSASTLGFKRKFDELRRARKSLKRFVDPTALLDALHRGHETSDQKNRILDSLVLTAQSAEPAADIALTLILLALWPGLDAVLRRAKWRRVGDADELPSEILARATEAIRCINLGRVHCVAATILMNIERDLVRAQQRQTRMQDLCVDIALDELTDYRSAPAHPMSADRLQHELAREIGADATLVIRVAVEGYSQAETGRDLGLTEAAARKRYQRAIGRLRECRHLYL